MSGIDPDLDATGGSESPQMSGSSSNVIVSTAGAGRMASGSSSNQTCFEDFLDFINGIQ